ncbi:MAG: glycosyltransferase [Deltaproteobacteria bacterium]|jgi:glycosyltransferase involved in cell wall biosynthesis|nr:glycosyltransferase [Deltaproteobacteria bacterium]
MISKIIHAEALAQSGKLEESREAFAEILAEDPNNARSLLGIGIIYFKLARYQEAIESFGKILEIKNNHLEALKSLVMAYAAIKDQKLALETLDKLISIRKKDPEILSFAAKVFNGFNQRDKALENINKALELTASNYAKQTEYNDVKALINGLPLPSKVRSKSHLTVCCIPGMDSFIHENIKRLSLYLNVTASVSQKPEDHINNIINANVIWLEWGNQLTKFILTQKNILSSKRVIVRIHSYEIYDRLVDQIDFSSVSDIVFVADFMRELFVKKNLPTAQNCRLNVIHNGIDVNRFSFVPRSGPGNDIAFLAYISYKKDPMVMMHAFSFLAKLNPALKLHVAGMYQDMRYELALPHFIEKAGLGDRVTIYGHINNPDEWFRDKDYILCTSLNESQGLGILEAMSRGVKPLVYNFPGSEDIYLPSYLWTTFGELKERYENPVDPKEVSEFVAKYYSKEREINGWLKLLLDNAAVDEKFDFSQK